MSFSRIRLGKVDWFHFEVGTIAFILLWLNWPLVQGVCNSRMIFLPDCVWADDWWRVLTHPFVHVTWFHLLLDGLAFFLLYHELQELRWVERLSYVLASGAGSLLTCLWADPMLSEKGLCGLSGIAHGLMAVSALNLMTQSKEKTTFRIGLGCFALVVMKCLIEALTGKMLFTFLHFGLMGDPVAVAHAGGVVGGAAVWLCFRQGRAADK